MGAKTGIKWTEATWNPSTGCDRISEGCDNCYALKQAGRMKLMGQPAYQTDGDPRTSGPGFGLQTHLERLDLPLRWQKPRMIFVNSMSDLFHARVPLEFIQDVFDVMERCPHHTFQVLTKRSFRLKRLAPFLRWPANVWMGVSVETDKYLDRIDDLRETPAQLKFVSAEPLLGSLARIDLRGIDWLIAGGESGAGFRAPEAEWMRELRDASLTSSTAFFFKQWGGTRPTSGGNELDGKTWEIFPEIKTGPTIPASAVRRFAS